MAWLTSRLPTWRYKRFHASVLLSWLALGLLTGVYFGQYFSVVLPLVAIAAVMLCVVVSLRSRRWYACCIVILSGCFIGITRGSDFSRQLHSIDWYVGHTVVLSGVITQDPILKNGSSTWQVQLDSLQVGSTNYVGEAYATVLTDETLKRGDNLTISGRALQGFGSFSLSFFRAEVIEISRQNDPFLELRDKFGESVKKVMPEPEASLGLGFLLGQKSSLPDDLTEQLKVVGLTHIVVASGYNLTILVRFARRLLARKSRYLALMGSLLLVAGFVMVSGFSPSMNRAAVVTVLTLIAWYYGRKFHPIKLILYVASLSAFLYPVYIWGDLGWLLSFAAFTGVLVVAPLLTRLFYARDRGPGVLTQLIIETLSAEIMTLPILVAAFGYVPLFALVSNVLVAPAVPFAMALTFFAGLIGIFAPWAVIIAQSASIVVAYIVAVVEFFAGLPGARADISISPIWVAAWYVIIASACAAIWRYRKVDLLGVSVVE